MFCIDCCRGSAAPLASGSANKYDFKRKIRTRLDLLSIPQSGGKNDKTFRWDHRLQIQNLFMAFNGFPYGSNVGSIVCMYVCMYIY